MFRTRSRGPRRPKVYRIPIETYLIALDRLCPLHRFFTAFGPKGIDYRLAHHFGVEEETFLPSAHALSNPSPVEGNRIRLLENGDAFFPAMLAAIARAKSSLSLETYIFWSGEIAGRFRDALSERARAGVEVRILLDAVGSGAKLSRNDVSAMRAAGCAVEFFHPLRPWMLDAINHRTHRRLLVVDGKVAFTGGAGVADVWIGNAEQTGHWRDTQVEVLGPVVAQLQSAFQENWAAARGELLSGERFFPRLEPAGQAVAQVILSSPESPSSPTKLLYAVSISSAMRRLWISNSYFLPDADATALLVSAARRGVDVHNPDPRQGQRCPAHLSRWAFELGRIARGRREDLRIRPHHVPCKDDGRGRGLRDHRIDQLRPETSRLTHSCRLGDTLNKPCNIRSPTADNECQPTRAPRGLSTLF